jgi:hypothetical protein
MGDVRIRIFVLILALLEPLIVIYCFGYNFDSLSTMWLTYLQPLFIVVNASTSYFLFGVGRWRISSIFLLLLTAFSVEYSILFHYIFAVLFFVGCGYGMWFVRRLRWYLVLYIISLVVLFYFGIFWGEIFAIYIICFYHLHLMSIYYKLNRSN